MDLGNAQQRAAAQPWVVLLLGLHGKEVVLGDLQDTALTHIFHKTWPKLKFRQKARRWARERARLLPAAGCRLPARRAGSGGLLRASPRPRCGPRACRLGTAEYTKLFRMAEAALVDPKAGLDAASWVELGLVEALAAALGEAPARLQRLQRLRPRRRPGGGPAAARRPGAAAGKAPRAPAAGCRLQAAGCRLPAAAP